MDLLHILVVLVVVGVVLFLIQTYVPMAAPIKLVINVIVVLFLCVWLLKLFGIADLPIGPRGR
jgi:hypothetical protein